MWQVSPTNRSTGNSWYSCKPWLKYSAPKGTEELLVIEDYVTAFSVFKAVSRGSAGTTIVTLPAPGGSLSLTDMILSADKTQNALVTLQFTDGVNTEVIFTIDTTDAPANMAIPIKGRMQGWVDARIELVTVNAVAAFLTLGYMRLPTALPYSEWDDLR